MMTKKLTALLLAALLLASVMPLAAADDALIAPHASDYLSGCTITTTPKGNKKISIDYAVYGTDEMTKIGATQIVIQRYDDYSGDWVYDRTLVGGFTYGEVTHAASTHFYGTVGEQYRALICAYAENADGHDSRVYDGSGVYCH